MIDTGRHPLIRLLAPQAPIDLMDPEEATDAAGAIICRARAPELDELLDAVRGELNPAWLGGGRVELPFSLRAAYELLVSEAWATPATRGSNRKLAAFYAVRPLIPRRMQIELRRALVRRKPVPRFPRWPSDTTVADLLRLLVRSALAAADDAELRFAWFWPDGANAAVILTHDVEDAAGLRAALEIADVEQERGLRSSFNVVGETYPLDHGILRELRERGFEIGLHGLKHDRSLFASRASFEEQRPRLATLAEELDAVGFRSPSTHRVLDWIAELPIEYDATVPLSDPYEPQPGGCCSPWPFFLGDVVELPWTLSQDHLVLTLLQHDGPQFWLAQADAIERDHGLIQCLTHPDPGYLGDPHKRRIYAEFLDAIVARPTLWHALPRDVARWWRDRDRGTGDPRSVTGVARLDGDSVTFAPA